MSLHSFQPGQKIQSALLNENFEGLADGSLIEPKAISPDKVALFHYQTHNGGSVANVLDASIKVQRGWKQVEGNGTTSISDTVTFPEEFTTILGFIAFQGPAKTSIGSSITDLNVAAGAGAVARGGVITTAQANVIMTRTSNYSVGSYYSYSWEAWGII